MIGQARHSELIANGNDANSRFARLGYVVMEERYAPAPRCGDYQDGGPIMKKLAILGIIGGAAILTAAPVSLQWSQKNVALSLDSAKAGTATSAAGVSRRVHRTAYRRAAYGTAVAGSGGYGYSSLANCGGSYLAYGTSYVAPCGQYSSSYAIADERLKAGYSVAPYSYYGPPSYSRRPSRIFY
jgi:hypothetical protein